MVRNAERKATMTPSLGLAAHHQDRAIAEHRDRRGPLDDVARHLQQRLEHVHPQAQPVTRADLGETRHDRAMVSGLGRFDQVEPGAAQPDDALGGQQVDIMLQHRRDRRLGEQGHGPDRRKTRLLDEHVAEDADQRPALDERRVDRFGRELAQGFGLGRDHRGRRAQAGPRLPGRAPAVRCDQRDAQDAADDLDDPALQIVDAAAQQGGGEDRARQDGGQGDRQPDIARRDRLVDDPLLHRQRDDGEPGQADAEQDRGRLQAGRLAHDQRVERASAPPWPRNPHRSYLPARPLFHAASRLWHNCHRICQRRPLIGPRQAACREARRTRFGRSAALRNSSEMSRTPSGRPSAPGKAGGKAGGQRSSTRISRLPTALAGVTTPCVSIISTSRAALL